MDTSKLINELSELKELIRIKAESEAIAKVFYANNGVDLDSFTVLLRNLFKPEFLEVGKDRNGFPIYKLTTIEANGEKIIPDTFFRQVKEGEFGMAIASTFSESLIENPKNQLGNQHFLTIKRSEKAEYLAQDRNGNFKKLLAAGKVRYLEDN